jgi:hypothetical protein
MGKPTAQADMPDMPMPVPTENTTRHRWLSKSVLAARLLDDMEDLASWSHHGFGQMQVTRERAHSGQACLRLTSPTKAEKPGPVLGRPFGAAVARRDFAGEDWSAFNRISFWVYPTLPGFRVISMCVVLHNEGPEKVPGPYGRNGRNFVLLEPDCWNHIVWEIAHLGRDKVSGVEFIYRLQGNEPGATTSVCYDIDQLELQRVEPDHFEGWNVAPGRIAYCHAGYPLNASKVTIASDLDAETFRVVDLSTGKAVLTKAVRQQIFALGTYQLLDFSELRRPGTYMLRAGDIRTRPFAICRDMWRDTIWATVNFFYCERCGASVPGIHDVCHRDWRVRHEDKEIPINGGWHDAGDLSQGLVNTSEAAYAMFALARHMQEGAPVLSGRLLEEARWGLDWILRTRFGDGHRCTWATMDFWTDGIMGTVDDVTVEARNRPFENFLAAATEALAARALDTVDPVRATYCLTAAREDWQFAHEKTERPNLELAAAALQSSLDLYEATNDSAYADAAFDFAKVALHCQQQDIAAWDVPLTGFFYRDSKKEAILHYAHRGHEQAPVVGLTRLCRLFPNHPDWMDWYAAVALYSEYCRAISRYTSPFRMLPASIYHVDESDRATFRQQVENGIELGDGYHLRRFPVWFDFRGNHGTVLSQTKGLAAAARLRHDNDLIGLCRRQLEWVLGCNPFCQSTMYGVGHDYAPQYTAMSGDMVGSLPVGIQTHFEGDAPYWPADNCYNFKEVWVHPSSRWLWLMCDLYETDAPTDTSLHVTGRTSPEGEVTLTCTARMPGRPHVAVRTWNLRDLSLREKSARTRIYQGQMKDKRRPWVAVVLPNGDVGESRDVVGNFPAVCQSADGR